jgi:hypothetical protein
VSAIAEYERLRLVVADADGRLRAALDARSAAVSALEAAEAELTGHIAAVHAGEREADPDREDELHRAARAAGEHVSVRLRNFGGTSEAVLVDLKAEARVDGARQAVEVAEGELRSFVTERLGELAAERAAGRSGEVGRRAAAALSVAWSAVREWQDESAWWAGLCQVLDRPELMTSSPALPFEGLQPPPAGVERGPVPRELSGL